MKKVILILISIFSISLSNAQALNAFIQHFHGAGCDNQSGKLAVVATGGTGTYTYLWSNGSTLDTAFNLGVGNHWVKVFSGNDSIIKYQVLDPWGIDTVHIINDCNGGFGSIYLDNINAQYPIQYFWYNSNGLMPQSTPQINNLSAGNYNYKIIDADGCSDSSSVTIFASSPILIAYASDSAICYGQSAQVWYTPGFTLYDNFGSTYISSTDTITVQNYMSSINYPSFGIDSFGCEASLNNNLFVYLQPHPDPVPLYQIGDTISVSFNINLNPSTSYIYTWTNGVAQISTGPYSYLPIDSSGYYAVSILNEWGCTNFGSIQAFVTNISENALINQITIANNPISEHQEWQIELINYNKNIEYKLYDLQGKLMLTAQTTSHKFSIPAPEKAGMYFLHIDGKNYKLIKR